MTRRLLVFLGETLSDPVSWGLIDNGQLIEGGRLRDAQGLKTLRKHQEGVDLSAAFLPGEQSILRRIETPPKSPAKFRAAAAYLLEDELSEPLEALHYVVQHASAGGRVLGVRDGLISAWLGAFEEEKLEFDLLTTDAAALLGLGDGVVVIRDRVRTACGAPHVAFACENALFDALAADLLGDLGDMRVQCLGEDGELPACFAGLQIDWLGPFDEAQRLEFFDHALNVSMPINLLQGAYRRKLQWRAGLAPWRRAGVILSGVTVLSLAAVAADARKHDRIGERWIELSRELHQRSFPEAASADPVANARAVLQAGGDNATFILVSNLLSSALEGKDDVQIDRIGFDSANGRFSVSVRGQSDDAIERLRRDLAELGVTVRDNGGVRQSRGFRLGEFLVELS